MKGNEVDFIIRGFKDSLVVLFAVALSLLLSYLAY